MRITNRVMIHMDAPQRRQAPVDVMQCDTDTRAIELALYEAGRPWDIPDGVELVAAYRKADGTKGLYDTLPDRTPACSASDNVISVILPPGALTVPGRTELTVLMRHGERAQLSTFPVALCIHPDPAVGAVESGDYINLQRWVASEVERVIEDLCKPVFLVKVTNEPSADQSLSDIHKAYSDGRTVQCLHNDKIYPLVLLNETLAIFQRLTGTTEYRVDIYADKIRINSWPIKVPNPGKLTFTGGAVGVYDGSEDININIPTGNEAAATENHFEISDQGVVSLKADYRGSGKTSYPESVGNGTQAALPDHLVIPDAIDGVAVTALAPGMFYGNTRVKEVTIPDTVTVIPEAFAMYASNLKAVNNTAHVTSIGSKAFAATRIKQAFFPNLTEMGTMAFASCGYLEIVDIGNIPEIPERAFADCAFLREVSGGEKVTSIGNRAFYHTRKLRDLPLLAHVTSVADYAFFFSRICTSLPAGGEIGTKAFPTVDNTTDFWTGVPYTPCQNRLTTKLSQANPAWKNDTVLTDTDAITYNSGCFLLTVLHIHAAITGKYYSDPRDFAAELKADGDLAKFLTTEYWAGEFKNVSAMFEALGYRTEVHGLADGDDLTAADYKALVDALAAGAYVYAQVGLYSRWQDDDFDTGHSVAIYGINELGEVCVLDSSIRHEGYRADGFEPDADVYTYTMPYQNLVGSSSNFVIVYPPNVEVKSAPTTLPNPHKLILNGAVQAEYDGSSAVTVTIPESSSGGDEMRHIITFSLEEDVSMTYIDKDSDGNPFELKELLVNIKSVGAESNTTGANFKLAINGTAVKASKILSDVAWAVRNANSFCSHTIKTISDGLVFYSFNFKADDTNVYDENMKLVACRAMSLSNIAPYETITSLVFSSSGAPKLGKGTIIAVWGR